jgi:hypothetical protein
MTRSRPTKPAPENRTHMGHKFPTFSNIFKFVLPYVVKIFDFALTHYGIKGSYVDQEHDGARTPLAAERSFPVGFDMHFGIPFLAHCANFGQSIQ